jgi:hypothetical protein
MRAGAVRFPATLMITLTIDVHIDDSALTEIGKQVPFAMFKAMNATMLKAQARQRARMRSIYTIRRPSFLNLAVKITEFAKKNSLVTELAIAPPGDREDVYAKFEAGGVKRPLRGKDIAIPVTGSPVKRNRTSIVADENKPRALLAGLSEVTTRTGRVKQVKRADSFGGAFIKPASGGKEAVIFIRRGRHLVLAYRLEPEVPIDHSLKFEETVTREYVKDFPAEWEQAMNAAIASARR